MLNVAMFTVRSEITLCGRFVLL